MDIYIKDAVIHAFDPGNPELLLSSQALTLTPMLITYITKKIEKIYSDEAKRGVLGENNAFLDHLTGDFMAQSIQVARAWRAAYQVAESPKASDLLFVSYGLDQDDHFAFIRLSLREAYAHHVDETGQVGIKKLAQSLPGAGSGADEGIVLNLVDRRYHLLEKRIKFNGKNYYYFSEDLLAEEPQVSINHAIKAIKKSAQSVARQFDQDDFQFSQKVQHAVFSAVESDQVLDADRLAEAFFPDNLTAKLDFKETIHEAIQTDQVKFDQVPVAKIEKKLANQKLSLSNGIEMIVPQSLYEDAESVEFIQNPDQTYSILIKNIEEIKNKW